MRSLLILAALLATPAVAQTPDPHAGHRMPAAPADPHAGHAMPAAPAADPHAGHVMPAPAPDPHAGHKMPAAPADPHAGHKMPAATPMGSEPAPAAPTDHAAARFYSPEAMAAARTQLAVEHGGSRYWKVMAETLEVRPSSAGDTYAWEGEAWYGGDIHRLVLKTEGEGGGGDLHAAEVQALYGRAIGPYFNLQAGVRQDLQPRPRRTYATVGFEGVAPYWFELEGVLFLSNKGELSARLEGSYDLRLTQKLILEPRAELNISAEDTPALGLGNGLTDAELGLRLRYAFTPEFAPYIGVNYERKLGDTADLARTAGEGAGETRLVVGLRAWF